MRIPQIFLVLLFISLLSTACGANLPEIISTPTSTSHSTVTPTINPEPTRTPTPPTETPLPTPTEETVGTCVQYTTFENQALPIDDLEGKITVNAAEGEQFIYDLKTGEKIPLDLFHDVTVSPDHTMIAFMEFIDYYAENQPILITDTNGEVLYTFPSENYYPVQWLDSNHLFLVKQHTFDEDSNPYPTRILSIDTGNIEEISFDLPGLAFPYHGVAFIGDVRMNVSPDRDYILYPSGDDVIGDLVIWNRKLNREVFRIPGLDYTSGEPSWSPDGERFAISILKPTFTDEDYLRDAGFDIVIADLEGNIERYNPSEDSVGNIYHPSWSPNGTKLAFLYSDFLAPYKGYGGNLMVLDLETGEITDCCIEGDSTIFWSLDGNYLILPTPVYKPNGYIDHTKITLVSLSELWAVDIYDEASIIGVVVDK